MSRQEVAPIAVVNQAAPAFALVPREQGHARLDDLVWEGGGFHVPDVEVGGGERELCQRKSRTAK